MAKLILFTSLLVATAWLSAQTLPQARSSAALRSESIGAKVVDAAKKQIGVTKTYDPKYVGIKYPGGDVDQKTGVCTDVVVRALRVLGVDLQKTIHEDMKANFSKYPKNWGLTRPDKNIDHRRVPNQQKFFERAGLKVSDARQPGDILAFKMPNGLLHIGIVSNQKTFGEYKIIHNIGSGTRSDHLTRLFKVIGHYRPTPNFVKKYS